MKGIEIKGNYTNIENLSDKDIKKLKDNFEQNKVVLECIQKLTDKFNEILTMPMSTAEDIYNAKNEIDSIYALVRLVVFGLRFIMYIEKAGYTMCNQPTNNQINN